MIRILQGDCRTGLPTLEQQFHAVVTDPPYELNFMGRKWDSTGVAFQSETWRPVYDRLLPGAYLVAFASTRGYHRMVCAIEDAGFIIHPMLAWLFGSGFPKGADASKAIDKHRRRDFVSAAIEMGIALPDRSVDDWTKENHAPGDKWWAQFKLHLSAEQWAAIERKVVGQSISGLSAWFTPGVGDITAPATPEAAQWSGWKYGLQSLKPALEPICLAQKPMEGNGAENLLKHGVGALNIDACRVSSDGAHKRPFQPTNAEGRYPANLIHDGSPEVLDAFPITASEGSPARFFYSAKADKADRADSKHPTVKPVDLIRYLIQLVTPPGGHILDPFAGTGTTAEAAMLLGIDCTLIEMDATHVSDIKHRIKRWSGEDAPLFAEVS